MIVSMIVGVFFSFFLPLFCFTITLLLYFHFLVIVNSLPFTRRLLENILKNCADSPSIVSKFVFPWVRATEATISS